MNEKITDRKREFLSWLCHYLPHKLGQSHQLSGLQFSYLVNEMGRWHDLPPQNQLIWSIILIELTSSDQLNYAPGTERWGDKDIG